jgi:hypothetical protein
VRIAHRSGKEPAMHRPLLPCFAVLATLTAVALLSAASTVRVPGVAPLASDAGDAANRTLAYRFYEAANAVIASGDPTGLIALLADEFVDATSPPDAEPDRETLVRRLLVLHSTAPDLRLDAETVATVDDLAIAQVRVDGAVVPLVAGPRFNTPWVPWGPVDVLRIVNGQIVERRGPLLDPIPVIPAVQLQVGLDLPSPDLQTLTITRVMLSPGARHAATARDGPRLILAESGTVALDTRPEEPFPDANHLSQTLKDGEHVSLPSRANILVTNRGSTPATVLDVSIAAEPFSDAAPVAAGQPREPGVIVDNLADHLLIPIPAGPAILTIDRLHLASGIRLGEIALDGPALLRVEAGELDLTATGEMPWVGAIAVEPSATGVEATMSAGGGALLVGTREVDIRVSATRSATLLIVALRPADEAPRDVVPSG